MITTAMAVSASQNLWIRAVTSLVSIVTTQCAVHRSAGRDRYRDVEDVRCQGVGGSGARRALAAQRLGDLGSGGEVALDGAGGVDQRDAVGVDDDHPGAGAFAVRGCRRGVERPVVLEVVHVEGGDDVRVVLEVGGDSLALALGEEHAERDLEEHEGQCRDQQVARQEATRHGSRPGGATSRNPTARTVSIRSGSSFLRSDAMCTSSVLVEPHQFSSHTSCMSCSRPLTAPGSMAR